MRQSGTAAQRAGSRLVGFALLPAAVMVLVALDGCELIVDFQRHDVTDDVPEETADGELPDRPDVLPEDGVEDTSTDPALEDAPQEDVALADDVDGPDDATIPDGDDGDGDGGCVGPCCLAGVFRPTTYPCFTGTEYGCSSTDCGGDALRRNITRYCPGDGAECNGRVEGDPTWTIQEDCTPNDVCQFGETASWCGACTNGCEAGACRSRCIRGPNVAPSATPTASPGGMGLFGPDNLNDNRPEGSAAPCYFSWVTAASASENRFFQFTWGEPQVLYDMHLDINRFDAIGGCYEGSCLTAAVIQTWNGTDWVTDGAVTGRTDDWDYAFTSPRTTTRVRLFQVCAHPGSPVHPSNPLVYEWQVFACDD